MPVKKKVLILGGGMGALSTAYWLSHTQAQRDAYDVSVISNGWRLGGKLASGRDEVPPFASYEHGLHVWFGFYDNAFHTLREVWDRWVKPPSCPIRTWEGVTTPCSFTPVAGQVYGQETFLDVEWPTNPAVPGEGGVFPNPWQYFVEAIRLFEIAVESLIRRSGVSIDGATISDEHDRALRALGLDVAGKGAKQLLRLAVRQAERLLDDRLERDIRQAIADVINFILGVAQVVLRPFVQPLTPLNVDAYDLLGILELGCAFFRGVTNGLYGIMDDGNLDRIDGLEYRQWLKDNGGDPDIVDNWRGVRSLYDCCFQYTDGDPTKPNFAAGTAARIMMRIITQYKGAVLYLFTAGVGETVIAPMFEVCKAQGVKFQLFTEVKHIHLDAAKESIAKVTLHKQVDYVGPTYDPLFEANGFKCWPKEPFWGQLVGGAGWKAAGVDFESPWGPKPPGSDYDVTAGVDFDIVVLATSLGAFKPVNLVDPSFAQELIDDDPNWKKLTEYTGLAPSVGLQLWMKPTLRGLGYDRPPPSMVGYTYPNAVWSDMTSVLPSEMWPDATGPKSLHYFCGNLGTTLYQSPKSAPGVQTAANLLAKTATDAQFASVGAIWPNAVAGGGLDPAKVVKQYLRANVSPTECCEGTPKDASQYRMAAGDTGYKNLVVAGAWIRTGINSSCVEGAVMSGMQASRAISGSPSRVVGEHFMHVFPHEQRHRRLPPYLSRRGHGEQSVQPPGIIKDAKTYFFTVPGNNAAMQQTVDQYLNVVGGSEVQYTVIGDQALLSFMDGAALSSTSEVIGNVKDREAAFWIPLLQKKRHDPFPTLCLWMPYVVVDTSTAAITGRESWGFLKEVGSCDFPYDAPAQKTFDANCMTFLNFSNVEMGQVRTLVKIHYPAGKAGQESASVIATFADIIAALVSMGYSLVHATQLVTVAIPLINVKQFRDAQRPTRACYQSLVLNNCKVEHLYGGAILKPGHLLDILPCASHQIAADFGFASNTNIPLGIGMLIRMDFSVDNGGEVHRVTP